MKEKQLNKLLKLYNKRKRLRIEIVAFSIGTQDAVNGCMLPFGGIRMEAHHQGAAGQYLDLFIKEYLQGYKIAREATKE